MSDSSSNAWFHMSRRKLVAHLHALALDVEAGKPPAANLHLPLIDNWSVARRAVPCLVGVPSGHPMLADGAPIFSSELYYMDIERGVARTFSRWYRLGVQAEAEYWNNQYRTPQ